MRVRQFWLLPFLNVDGGGGAGSGGGGSGAGGESGGQGGGGGGGAGAAASLIDMAKPDAGQKGQDGQPGGQAPASGSPAPYWPDGLPEPLAGLKGQTDRETIDKLAGELKGLPRAPAKPEDYKVALPEAFTKRYGDLGNDEVMPIWRQVAHKNGLSEAQFNGAISELYQALSEKGLIDEPLDVGAEFEKLMPKHGDPVSRKAQASGRINGVANTITGLVNRQVLTKTEGNMVLSLAARAEGFPTPEAVLRRALDIAPVGPC
jgi:hypothetical protein